MTANPYDDPGLKEAWQKGWTAGGKRHISRAANPYFIGHLKQAWNDGYDARKVSKGRTRFL